jgi:decaprenyl-phosphate phosphoribosyltransferase
MIKESPITKVRVFLQLARPDQYVKNGFVFLPLIFGHQLFHADAVAVVLVAFAGFCLASSAVYVFNDLLDVEEDRIHPVKCHRPLASGRISPRQAAWFGALLAIGSLGVGFCLLNWTYIGILIAYLLLNIAYSLRLKHMAIIDVVSVSTGFVLRVFAGGVVIGILPTHWLVLMTFLVALFISLAKRRDDLLLLARSGNSTRRSLDGYNLEFVSGAMMIMAAVTIVSYILYTLSPDVIQKHSSRHLYLTSFWVIIGLLRYMQITFVSEKSGAPTQVLLKDPFLQVVVVLWLISFLLLTHVARV